MEFEISDRTKSYNEGVRNRITVRLENAEDNPEKRSLREIFLEDNNIQKVINYDDKKLSLTKEQLDIDTIINKKGSQDR